MPEIKSLTRILKEEHIDDPTTEDILRLKGEGKIRSAYSNVVSLSEFKGVRWGPFHDGETWGDFEELIKNGALVLNEDPLGVLLQTANFFGDGETIEMEWARIKFRESYPSGEEKDVDEQLYEKRMAQLKKAGINPKKDTPWLANLGSSEECKGNVYGFLRRFVQKWYDAKPQRTDWNPAYAAPLKSERFYQEKEIGSNGWLNRWNEYQVKKKEEGDSYAARTADEIIFPFNGWTLAEVFKRNYERQPLKKKSR